MLSLGRAEWNLGTLLELFLGLIDRSEDVRLAALDALMDIAKRHPEPLQVSPIRLLAQNISLPTVASGFRSVIFCFLLELDTPEADYEVRQILRAGIRNEDFGDFLDILVETGKLKLLEELKQERLSKAKTKILREVLQELQNKQ